MELLNVVHIVAEAAILILVIKGTRMIDRIDFKVELLWEEYQRNRNPVICPKEDE